ncbi:MAG: hypothetical protein AMK73_02495 [Planctomycetes bacterium SM23_32]|nr:MAG: hypothetical protein AMK73_02495 [Planctomycetes bacterium SM23_32]
MRDREPGGERLPTAADAAVRREVIASTDRTMLVEAAAGTGKTTLIVDRILQAVLDGRIRLARTVAITFTEKAAGELESRVRAGLTAALHRGGLSDAERGRVQEAVEELDRAHVCTIHAFCAHLLREKAAEAGVDPEFTVLDETPRHVLIERAWQDWMTAAVAEAPDVLVEALRAGVSRRRSPWPGRRKRSSRGCSPWPARAAPGSRRSTTCAAWRPRPPPSWPTT